MKPETFQAIRPYIEAVQPIGAAFPRLRIACLPAAEGAAGVSFDDLAYAQQGLDGLNSAIESGLLVYQPGLATLSAPNLEKALTGMYPSIFNAADAATTAEAATLKPAAVAAPLLRLELEAALLVPLLLPGIRAAFPQLAPAPPAAPLGVAAIIAAMGFQWFPPGFFIELTPAGTNALIIAAAAGAGAATALLTPIVGAGAAAIIGPALGLAVAAMRAAQALSIKGAIKLKIIPVPAPGVPIVIPWPA